MKNNLIFIIMGKSGAGKTSTANEVSTLMKIPIVVSSTSRPMRENEVDGIDYYYKSEEEMRTIASRDGFVEFVTYNNWLYGVEKAEIDRISGDCLVVVEPKGYKQFKEVYGERVIPIYIETSDKNRMLRSLQRELKPNCKEICRRLLADTIDFKEVEKDSNIKHIGNDRDDYFTINEVCNFIESFY